MTPLRAELVDLLSEDSWTRRTAIEQVDTAQAAGRYALRQLLWHDADAAVRSAAALQLARTPSAYITDVSAWLDDALDDHRPLVREAVLRAWARMATRLPALIRGQASARAAVVLSRDPIWWVRRAAVLAYCALLSPHAPHCIALLRQTLADPFWRVRHAAAQALFSIGEQTPTLRDRILAGSRSLPAAAQAGLWYLRARWLPGVDVHAFPTPQPDDALNNADPAVSTARLRALSLDQCDPDALVSLLSDPHEPLRVLAAQRLRLLARTDRGVRALRSALKWLETPTQPRAAETVAALLDGLGDPARTLAAEVLGADVPCVGALRWACAYVAQTECDDLLPALLRQSAHPEPRARAAVLEALSQLRPLATDALSRALSDDDAEVASVAAVALARTSDSRLHSAIWHQPLRRYVPLARRMLVDLALRTRALEPLTALASDPHALVRAHAIRALSTLDALAPNRIDALVGDPDPAVRLAALPLAGSHLLALLEADPDPSVRRHAMARWMQDESRHSPMDRRRAATAAMHSGDARLRCQAALLLRPNHADDVFDLLALSGDTDEGVRAAAADALEDASVVPQLRQLLSARDGRMTAMQRTAAYSLLALHEGEACRNLLVQAEQDSQEPDAVRALLPTLQFMTDLPDAAPPVATLDPAVAQDSIGAQTALQVAGRTSPTVKIPAVAPQRRTLGRTGLRVSPLGLSGAYEPPLSALRAGQRAGVNLFFWEPGYLNLTRFLRGGAGRAREEIVVVTGSFEGDRFGIQRDVDTALRRLRTHYLDVLLLLWVRSKERLSEEALSCLRDLKASGKIRAFGFSTHHRDLAEMAIQSGDWDVAMLRHSAAHPGAEDRLLPLCNRHNVGVITFSALSYGRLLRAQPTSATEKYDPRTSTIRMPTAAECYRYTLSQPGVSACWSAPRSHRELAENLEVLHAPPLSVADCDRLRAHGVTVRSEDRRFSAFLRRGHEGGAEVLAQIAPLPISADGYVGLPSLGLDPSMDDAEPATSTTSVASSDSGLGPDREPAGIALEPILDLLESGSPEEDPAVDGGDLRPPMPERSADTRVAGAPGRSPQKVAQGLSSGLSPRRKPEKM